MHYIYTLYILCVYILYDISYIIIVVNNIIKKLYIIN